LGGGAAHTENLVTDSHDVEFEVAKSMAVDHVVVGTGRNGETRWFRRVFSCKLKCWRLLASDAALQESRIGILGIARIPDIAAVAGEGARTVDVACRLEVVTGSLCL
jgi:hypothetical protein